MIWRTACVLALLCSLVGCGPGMLEPRAIPPAPPSGVKAGKGYYLTELPPGGSVPQDLKGRPAKPKVSKDFKQTVTSNKWWSSLIWQYQPTNPYSENMYPHPLAVHARAGGLGLSYPTKPEIDKMYYMYWYDEELLVGLKDLAAPDTHVAAYSDWTVTAEWNGKSDDSLRATFGHGLPFVYFTKQGSAPASVRVADDKKASLRVWKQDKEVLGISVNGHNYGLFAPSGSEWVREGDAFTSTLNGKDFWSVAVLPDDSNDTFEMFRRHAYAFVTDTHVNWEYDAQASLVKTHFKITTSLKQQGDNLSADPVIALYRHQWLNMKADFLKQSYISPRGKMLLLETSEFTTELKWQGMLPVLPNVANPDDSEYSASYLEYLVKRNYWADDLFPPEYPGKERDSYWVGKSLGRNANVIQIADQLGYTKARDFLLQAVKNELQDWFDGHAPSEFYYDKTWRMMVGFPEGYWSSAQMNDHHFHWAYFVMAAAVVARYDQAWAKDWGPFVDLLIKDAANWDRDDSRFPFLRYMDPYEGHSWANGPQLFNEGNNEEASSEDVNFSSACILWGSLTGNESIRDLGIYLYASQTSAIPEYWFDVDHQVFPKGFDHPAIAMVWGAGGWYKTWWDEDPNYVHGINYVPFTGGSLYHGRRPDYVLRNYDALDRYNHGQIWTWRDFIIMYLAMGDPDKAVKLYEEDPHLTFDTGSGEATLYHWVYNLKELGLLDTSITADVPTYAVFKNKNTRTYVAFNPTSQRETVKFSDGTQLSVEPRTEQTKRAPVSH